jgi:hypothetical protein
MKLSNNSKQKLNEIKVEVQKQLDENRRYQAVIQNMREEENMLKESLNESKRTDYSSPMMAVSGLAGLHVLLKELEEIQYRMMYQSNAKERQNFANKEANDNAFHQLVNERLEMLEKADQHEIDDFLKQDGMYHLLSEEKDEKLLEMIKEGKTSKIYLEEQEEKEKPKEKTNERKQDEEIEHEQ